MVASSQGNVREKNQFSRSGKSRGILWKVTENLWKWESQGKVREFCDARNDFYCSRHLFVPYFSASYGCRFRKSLHLFLCYEMFFLHNSFLGRKYVCWSQFLDLSYLCLYFASQFTAGFWKTKSFKCISLRSQYYPEWLLGIIQAAAN